MMEEVEKDDEEKKRRKVVTQDNGSWIKRVPTLNIRFGCQF